MVSEDESVEDLSAEDESTDEPQTIHTRGSKHLSTNEADSGVDGEPSKFESLSEAKSMDEEYLVDCPFLAHESQSIGPMS